MQVVRFIIMALLIGGMVSCSKSGKGGTGMGGDEEGTIPIAGAGAELGDVNFAFDSSVLNDRSKDILKANVGWLKDNSGRTIVIEGHCDERGTAEYNLALGERRARSAFDFMRSLGVGSDRMNTISYGEELPLERASNEGAWSKNRRAHFSIKN